MILGLLPEPKKVKWRRGFYCWRPGDRLLLAPESGEEDLWAYMRLRDELSAGGVTGILIDRGSKVTKNRGFRGLRVICAHKEKYGEEGYRVRITSQGVEVEAASTAGQYYAVQTLRQMTRKFGRKWPQLEIEDAPAFRYRGLMINIRQWARVIRPEMVMKLAEELSYFKLNVLQLYIEDGVFRFKSHPDIGRNDYQYTPEDMLRIGDFCKRHHIDFQPCLNSFGHMARILKLPPYRHLAETKECQSLSPVNPGTYHFLKDLYADYLPLFSSNFFYVCCDEVPDLGKGQSRRLAEKIGLAGLYARHVKKVQRLAGQYGKRIIIAGDMCYWNPNILDLLSKDTIIANWHYQNEMDKMDHFTKVLREEGFGVWISTGTSNWISLMTRHFTAQDNIRTFVSLASRYGVKGVLNTHWDDGGITGIIGADYHGMVLEAVETWTPGKLNEKEFDEAFSFHALGDSSGRAMKAIRNIGWANDEMGCGLMQNQLWKSLNNKLSVNHLLLAFKGVNLKLFQKIIKSSCNAEKELENIRDPKLRRVYKLSARMTNLAGRKTLIEAQIGKAIPSYLSLREIKKELKELHSGIMELSKEYSMVWREWNTPDILEASLKMLRSIALSCNIKRFEKIVHDVFRLMVPKILSSILVPYGKKENETPEFELVQGRGKPLFKTTAKIRYDSRALYITFVAYQPALRGINNRKELERISQGDRLEVWLSRGLDRPYMFTQIVSTISGHNCIINGAKIKGIEVKAQRRGDYWEVMIAIPFAGLGVKTPPHGEVWRGDFCRSNYRDGETSNWALRPIWKGFWEDPYHLGILRFE